MAHDRQRSSGKRVKRTGKGNGHSFIGLPHYILRSSEFAALDAYEVKLLIDLAAQYSGKNNGDFSAAFEDLKHRSWNSSATLSTRLRSLEEKGWTLCTRQGGSHRCSLYAITWWPLDDIPDKDTMFRAERTPRHSWKGRLGHSPSEQKHSPGEQK